MSARVVLVTGVSRPLGGRLAGVLAADPSIERVIGVDTVAPPSGTTQSWGRTEFVRVDIRNPLIAKVVAAAEVDTVVHMGVLANPGEAGGRAAMKETNIIGTMQLLAACQKAPSTARLVLRSATAVYGASPRDPALFTEDLEPRTQPRAGYAKDAVEVEGYARGFGRRRPDVVLTLLRFTNVLGPTVDSALARWFSLPVVPTVLGYDPRLQLCHEDDAVEVLRRTATQDHPGTFNVGGPGALLLSQAVRRTGRPTLPVPPPVVGAVARALRRGGKVDVTADQLRFLRHGRVVDVRRLERELGWLPRPTAETLDDFAAGSTARRVTVDTAAAAEQRLLEMLERRHASRSGREAGRLGA